jgi:glycosyltransferase involved in cell wall biosynthesis
VHYELKEKRDMAAVSENDTRLSSLSIVFPAYNEESNIEKAVDAARQVLQKYAQSYEIVVVNDGSKDRTGEIIDRLSREDKNVVPVHLAQNSGYGRALRTGLYKARCDYVFFSDSDLQFDLNEINKLIEWIGEYDIVVGYRAKRADPFHRKLNAWAWNRLVRILLGVKVRDIDCAFKLFRRKVLDTIKLDSAGALVNTEMFALAAQNKFTVKEVPVSHFERRQGQQTGANPKVILKAFRELFAMYGRLKLKGTNAQ